MLRAGLAGDEPSVKCLLLLTAHDLDQLEPAWRPHLPAHLGAGSMGAAGSLDAGPDPPARTWPAAASGGQGTPVCPGVSSALGRLRHRSGLTFSIRCSHHDWAARKVSVWAQPDSRIFRNYRIHIQSGWAVIFAQRRSSPRGGTACQTSAQQAPGQHHPDLSCRTNPSSRITRGRLHPERVELSLRRMQLGICSF